MCSPHWGATRGSGQTSAPTRSAARFEERVILYHLEAAILLAARREPVHGGDEGGIGPEDRLPDLLEYPALVHPVLVHDEPQRVAERLIGVDRPVGRVRPAMVFKHRLA